MFDLKNFEKRWSNTWFKVANKKVKRRLDTILFCDPDSAIYQSVYVRRKILIEYIYESDINISEVQKLGEVSL